MVGRVLECWRYPVKSAPDTGLLSTLARHHREPVPGYGRAAVFGCYAVIEQPGRIQTGEGVAMHHARHRTR